MSAIERKIDIANGAGAIPSVAFPDGAASALGWTTVAAVSIACRHAANHIKRNQTDWVEPE
jgi:O-acetyl-ADP-ribose deacetylase (regulator of RNase III)